MGIWGLQSLMKYQCEGGFERVNLSELIKLYRCKTGKNPVIFLELSSTIRNLNLNPFDSLICGRLKALERNVEIFINNFSKLGVNLIVVADGFKHPKKLEDWIEKSDKFVKNLERLYMNELTDFDLSEAATIMHVYLVANPVFQTSDKCEYIRAIGKGDEYIINHIKKNECFAVLTNDSNFILVEGAQYCLSVKDLNLSTMTTFNYNRKNLAKYLDLSTSQLPLLGSLLCDCSYSVSPLLKKQSLNPKKKINGMSQLVRKLPSVEKILQNEVDTQHSLHMSGEDMSRWIKNIKFFSGDSKSDMMFTGNENWDEIITFAKIRHAKGVPDFILNSLSRQVVYLTPSWSNVLKPLPDCALLPLRKQLYGILFFEYPYWETPVTVTEHCYTYCEDIKRAKYTCRRVEVKGIEHPGLLKMWSRFPSEDIQEKKREVFCQALDHKLSPKDLKDIEEELLLPFLIAFYLFWKSEIKIQEFEVKIILIQAILVQSLSEEEIEQYIVDIDIDAINLSCFFVKAAFYLNILNYVCGEPFCVPKTNLINYFDGKVLHHVYNSEKSANFGTDDLKVWSLEVWRKFNILNNKLHEIGRKCGFYKKN